MGSRASTEAKGCVQQASTFFQNRIKKFFSFQFFCISLQNSTAKSNQNKDGRGYHCAENVHPPRRYHISGVNPPFFRWLIPPSFPPFPSTELNDGEGVKTDSTMSWGVEDKENDREMSNWNVSLMSPRGFFYSLKIFCDQSYPNSLPKVKFVDEIPHIGMVNRRTGDVVYIFLSMSSAFFSCCIRFLRFSIYSCNF